MAVNNLAQNNRSKRKFLDLKTDAGEVLGLEQSSYAVKRGLLACEMSAKQLPHWFYTRLRSKTGSKNENYQGVVGDGEEHEEHGRTLRQIYFIGQAGLPQTGESRRSSRFSGQIRVMQRPELVTMRRPAAATAAELEQGSSGARKKTKKRGVAEGPSGRPIYKASS